MYVTEYGYGSTGGHQAKNWPYLLTCQGYETPFAGSEAACSLASLTELSGDRSLFNDAVP
jgi:hypothetical protein